MSLFLRRVQYDPSRFRRFRRFYKNVKSQNVFIVLMILSAITMFLPIRWTGSLEKYFQAWLSPAGHMTILAAQKLTGEQTVGNNTCLTDEGALRMQAALSLKLQELEAENRSLMGLRGAMGERGSLLPAGVATANVVGFDSMGLPSVEIDKGTFAGVKEGCAVLAAMPLDLFQETNLDPRLAIAAGMLVGVVAYHPGPLTSRVELISAPNAKVTVFIMRFENGRSKIIARGYGEGTAKGKEIVVKNVPASHEVEVGDFVVPADPEKLNLPNPVVIGRVTRIDPSTDDRHFINLTIEPFFHKTGLRRVYVLIP
jgi:cell shape-determining protein MreC